MMGQLDQGHRITDTDRDYIGATSKTTHKYTSSDSL